MAVLTTSFRFMRRVFQIWGDANSSRMAAALAYYAMLSLSPSLVLAIAIAAPIYSEQLIEEEIVDIVSDFTTEDVGNTIANLISNASEPETGFLAGGLSLIILVIGASSVFTQLVDTINDMWSVPPKRRNGILHTLLQRVIGIVMVLIVSLLLVGLMVFSTVVTRFADLISEFYMIPAGLLGYLDQGFSFLLMPLVFASMFRYLPDIEVAWRDVIGAAVVTSVLMAIGRYLIAWYIGLSSTSAVYGAAGSLVVLLTWIYLTGMILFFGAAFSRAYAEMFGSQRDVFQNQTDGE